MKRRFLVVVVAFVLLLRPEVSSADPGSWASLGQILAWLDQMDQTLQEIDSRVESIRTKLADVYPRDVLQAIQIVLAAIGAAVVATSHPSWRLIVAFSVAGIVTVAVRPAVAAVRRARGGAALRNETAPSPPDVDGNALVPAVRNER